MTDVTRTRPLTGDEYLASLRDGRSVHIDGDKAVHEVEDVYVHVVAERDGGMVVSGAKMLATGSAVTHATFVAQNSAVQLQEGRAEDYALVFIAPMDTPGQTLICRSSYE